MANTRLFEDFGRKPQAAQPSVPATSAEDIEDLKLKAFEQGYGAGWDDAIRAQADSGKLLTETMQQSLLDARLTSDAAQKAFISATRPLIESLIGKILPAIAERTLPEHVAGLLVKAIEEASDLPVEIRVSPDELAAVSRILDGEMPGNSRIAADEDLERGQACFALGTSEKQIDLPELISEISAAVESFYHSVQEEV